MALADAPVAHGDVERERIDAAEVLPWCSTVDTTLASGTPSFFAWRP